MKEIKELIGSIQYIIGGEDSTLAFENEDDEPATAANQFPDEHTLNTNTAIDTHLRYIKILLERTIKDPESVNIATIQEVMRYIESIRIENPGGLFSSKSSSTLGDKLSREKKDIFPPSSKLNIIPTFSANHPISRKNCDIFTTIHDKLCEIITPNLAMPKGVAGASTWVYSYPKDESNHVFEPALRQWETAHAELLPGDPAYHKDFVRDYSILNMLGKTRKNVDFLLDYLLKNSTYTEEENALILPWLKANGGQDNNRFIDLLLLSGAYTNGTPANQFKSNGIVQNWTISDEGKIIFQLETVLQGLVFNGDVYQINPETGDLETVELIDDDSHNLLPSMAIKASIELDVEGGKVRPHVTDLVVTSFSRSLLTPRPSAPIAEATSVIKPK